MNSWPELPPLVEIFWEDHFSMGDDWHEPSHRHDPCVLSAVGYLVGEDERYYYVACTYELDSGRYNAGTAVLKNCVVRYKDYTRKRPIIDQKRKVHKTSSKPIRVKE